MTNELNSLKTRSQKLSFGDENELNDIIVKAKMYLKLAFPHDYTYHSEPEYIKFKPSVTFSREGEQIIIDKWNKGKNELINLLDTRIKELEIRSTHVRQKVVKEVVEVQDLTRVNQLESELKLERKKVRLWFRIDLASIIGIVASIIGGSFLLGKYFGENRFDKEKIELIESNKSLNEKNEKLIFENKRLNKEILNNRKK